MIQEVALSGNEGYSSHKSSTAESFSLSSGLNPLVVIFSVAVLFVLSQYLYIVFRDHRSFPPQIPQEPLLIDGLQVGYNIPRLGQRKTWVVFRWYLCFLNVNDGNKWIRVPVEWAPHHIRMWS